MDEIREQTVHPWRVIVAFTIVVASVVVMLYLYYFYPHQVIGPKQPIYFSHRVHAGVKGISCQFCHPFTERSKNAGIPAVGKCLFCHRYIITGHPQIRKVRWHYDTKAPIPWVGIYYVPDHVQFKHQPHIRKEIDCTTCHGEVKKMDRLKSVEFEMGFCIECHKIRGAQLDCWLACHN